MKLRFDIFYKQFPLELYLDDSMNFWTNLYVILYASLVIYESKGLPIGLI